MLDIINAGVTGKGLRKLKTLNKLKTLIVGSCDSDISGQDLIFLTNIDSDHN